MNPEIKAKLAEFLERLYCSTDVPLKELEIASFKSAEPLPFADRLRGKKSSPKEGEVWAKKLFDCAWMKFSCALPKSLERKNLALKLDVNGEMLVVDAKGNPLQGLTCKASKFCDSLGKPAKRIFIPSAAELEKSRITVWADCALNDLFGRLKGDGKIACARLVRINPEIRSLYYLFEHAFDWLCALGPKSNPETAASLQNALLETAGLFGENLESLSEGSPEIPKAKKILEKALFKKRARPKLEISAIGHAHMDLAWLWPIRETKRKLARTFATVLALQKRYPQYVYGASQPQAYLWMKREYPSLYARIKEAVARGKIEPLGAAWVEPDCNLPSGESLVRQMMLGREFFKGEFGVEPEYFWIPDSFGYSPQLPQILLKSGVKYFITQKISWNTVNKFPHHSFVWEGIDSSRVLAHMLPEDTYNSPAAPRSLLKIEKNYAQKDASNNALMAFGIGDGGGGPGEEHLERILKNKRVCGLNKIKNRSVKSFLKDLEKESANFPVWRGDLYLERHQGTFTTQGRNKKHNRICENLLFQAEWFAYVLERMSNKKAETEFLKDLWSEFLLYQFHDILPGSSIERVYKESCAGYEVVEKKLREYIDKCAAKIGGLLGFKAVFNTTSWLAKKRLGSSEISVPKLGFAPLKSARAAPRASARKGVLENEKLAVKFNSKGEIFSFIDKNSKLDFADKSRPANVFMVYDDFGDAWDFGNGYRSNKRRAMKIVSSKFHMEDSSAVADFEFEYGSSKLRERAVLDGGADTLKLEISLDWRDRRKMLRYVFPLGIKAQKSVSEVAFGSYERSANDATKWRRARLETPAHQWAALRSKNRAFAVLNDCKYGHRLKDSSIEVGILRCVPRPGEPLVSVSDKPEDVDDFSRDFADLGRQSFALSLYPMPEGLDRAKVSARARALNSVFKVSEIKGAKAASEIPEAGASFVEISNPAVELVAMKPSQDGKAWVARFVNLNPAEELADLNFAFKPSKVELADLSERAIKKTEGLRGVKFGAHEIKTFKLFYKF